MANGLDTFSASAWTNNVTSVTLAHQCIGSQVALIVFVQIATAITPTATVTYGGKPMIAVQSNFTYAASGLGGGAFILLNPPSGTNNIVATLSATGTTTNLKVTGISLTGVRDVSSSLLNQALSANMAGSIGTKFANDWIITANHIDGNDTITAPIGFTQITNNGTATSTVTAGAVALKGPIASPSIQGFSWLSTASDNNFVISLVVSAANPPPYKGPYKISPSLGALNSLQSSSQLVRTSTGNLYSVISSSGDVDIYKSVDKGQTWNEQDYHNTVPTGSTNITAAIDGNNVIHIGFSNPAGLGAYISFNTSTDTYGRTEVVPSASTGRIAIAVDSNNIPHIIVGQNAAIGYSNRTKGSWKPVVSISGGSFNNTLSNVDLHIDQNNVPQFSTITGSNTTGIAIGNKNDATAFTINASFPAGLGIGEIGRAHV